MSNIIHPTSIIEAGVILGKNNYIGPFCYIKNGTVIGDNNRFEGYCSIGMPAEHASHIAEIGFNVIIGNNNVLREFVTINNGTNSNTVIKNNITMLRGSHVGHDSIINNDVTLACNALLGGHCLVMAGVNLGLGSVCHQSSVLGAYAMIGMGGVVTKTSKILPGRIYVGNPVKFLKINKIGLERNGIDEKTLAKLILEYNKIVQDGQAQHDK